MVVHLLIHPKWHIVSTEPGWKQKTRASIWSSTLGQRTQVWGPYSAAFSRKLTWKWKYTRIYARNHIGLLHHRLQLNSLFYKLAPWKFYSRSCVNLFISLFFLKPSVVLSIIFVLWRLLNRKEGLIKIYSLVQFCCIQPGRMDFIALKKKD